jgi:DNA-binding PadR family transcriptional regulator
MIIRALEEKSGGKYVPSPGTIYPTLQMLEDLGFVRPQADDERRVYHITEAGTAELQAHAAEVAEFWQRFQNDGGSRAAQAEQNFLTTEVEELARTVEAGFRTAAASDDLATIVKIREEIERCKNRVRAIIAGHDS